LKLIKTPWGSFSPEVSLFPIYYLVFIYGFIYILPFGENIVGLTWFNLLKLEDGPLEWLQFFEYFFSSIFGILIFWKSKNKNSINSIIWLFLSALSFFIAAEEISWGERITGFSLDSLTEISIQGETNLHNLPFFHNLFLDPLLIIICIVFGWIGWKKWPHLTSIPSKKLSLYFLITALYIFYYEISWASTIDHIRNDLEIYEFLLSTGFFMHFFDNLKSLKFK
tara:strand:- start:169 stop:840 length:672 start_codon:yes stop_codon:yes gene_type:complete